MSTQSFVLALLPAVVALFAVLATFFGVIRSTKSNEAIQDRRIHSDERTKSREVIRAKGEEVFLLVSDFNEDFRHIIVEVAKQLNARKLDQAFINADFKSCMKCLLRIELGVRVYVPSAVGLLEKVKAEVSKRSGLFMALADSANQVQLVVLSGQFLQMSINVEQYCDELQSAIVESLRAVHSDVTNEFEL